MLAAVTMRLMKREYLVGVTFDLLNVEKRMQAGLKIEKR
jgi:hypothetical protein